MGCLSWANLRCLSCPPLGKTLCEMGLFDKQMFTRGTAFADIRISGIIPREIIFWYREIINFSVSGIDFSPLHREILTGEIRTVLSPCSMESSSQWSTRPAVRLIDGEDSHTIQMIFTSNKEVRACQWLKTSHWICHVNFKWIFCYDFISNVLKYGNERT